jgi:hypothetical protein
MVIDSTAVLMIVGAVWAAEWIGDMIEDFSL